jgi:hypothetical protein
MGKGVGMVMVSKIFMWSETFKSDLIFFPKFQKCGTD